MDMNDEFDLDFDFEKEYGFSPDDNADADLSDVDMDFVNDLLEETSVTEDPEPESQRDTFDDSLELDLDDPIFDTDMPDDIFSEDEEETPLTEDYAPQTPVQKSIREDSPQSPKKVRHRRSDSKKVEHSRAEHVSDEKTNPSATAPRRRRKKTKLQIFKETYLPYVIMGAACLLCLIFIVGSIGRAVDSSDRENDKLKESESLANLEAEQAKQLEKIKNEAIQLAAGYDYAAAIAKLESIGDLTAYSDLVALKSEYSLELSRLEEWKNPSDVANLSFHALIADPARAFADKTYGTKYNQNFVTVTEFEKILEQLYTNGYVLVSLDDVVVATTSTDGVVSYSAGVIKLPSGKKPIMITETLVNYFNYMIDGDGDGKADKDGAGFASRLVVQNGEIKAEMVNAEGETVIGNYDLVPILEDFIASHPDFSYKGARAILAVSGKEGVFGYRINDGDEAEIAGAKEVITALRAKGYEIACNTFENRDYSIDTAVAIKNDLQSWDAKITPVLGDVDILVFAQGTDISEYSGYKFEALYSSGFRYFIGASTTPTAELTTQYFHQKRLMVSGLQMANASSNFSKYFNSMSILESSRGTIPT